VLLIDLLTDSLACDKFQFLPKLPEISSMLSKALLDPNPEMKTKAAEFTATLSRELHDKAGGYMKLVVGSLVNNLQHQHSKVRKVTLLGLRDVIVARGAEQFLEDALPQLKNTANDRSSDVRTAFYRVVEFWLQKLEIHSLKVFEKSLVMALLNGIADENEEIREKAIGILETHGKNMKEALQELGEL